MRKNHWEKEWDNCLKKEISYLNKNYARKENYIQKNWANKVPTELENALYNAFALSFKTIFEKGTIAIEKTMKLDELENNYKINNYAYELKNDKKTLRKFPTDVKISNANNVLFSAVKGISLGALGVGLPDIPILITTIFRGIYKIAVKYGYEFNTVKEQFFILTIIETAFVTGEKLDENNSILNEFIQKYEISNYYDQQEKIEDISHLLSTELITMKFIQGVPIVGAVGGVYDAIFIERILKLANIKYYRRFLLDKAERLS